MGPRAGGHRGDGSGEFFAALIAELLEFADAEWALSKLQDDGAPLRGHLLRVQEQAGITDPLLEVECPEALVYLWEYFQRVNVRRIWRKDGPEKITNAELLAWSQLHCVPLASWEAEVLEMMETRFHERHR